MIVVLGLALNSDGSPKQELLERIDKAFTEANSRPEAKLVLTGHGGEAKVMAERLEKKGIDGERLFFEEKAKDTVQNAYYSLTVCWIYFNANLFEHEICGPEMITRAG